MRNWVADFRTMARSIAPLAALVALAMTATCTAHDSEVGDNREGDRPDFSVYDLGSAWRDQSSAPRTLSSLKGHPQLLALVYTSCVSTCPLTVSAMQLVEAKASGDVGFVLVSLDPARDGPAQLTEFAKQHGLSSRWTLLSGDEKSVRELAAVLGVKYRRVSPNEIDHTSTLTVLDSAGRTVAQFAETDAADRAVQALQRLGR